MAPLPEGHKSQVMAVMRVGSSSCPAHGFAQKADFRRFLRSRTRSDKGHSGTPRGATKHSRFDPQTRVKCEDECPITAVVGNVLMARLLATATSDPWRRRHQGLLFLLYGPIDRQDVLRRDVGLEEVGGAADVTAAASEGLAVAADLGLDLSR